MCLVQLQKESSDMLHFDEIVFGPIQSRRLGSSLGMNILPPKGKLCNFDCVYCECGWNKDGISGGTFPGLGDVSAALEAKLNELTVKGVKVDSITFSGNGEPTLHPDFSKIIDVTLQLRDKYFPEAKVSALSNATMLGHKDVVDALMRIDNPILKIDASSDELISKINRPQGAYSLSSVIGQLKGCRGKFILQTMFLHSDAFNALEEGVIRRWQDIVREISPREIMVYTIDRETPDKTLRKCSIKEMESFVRPLVEEGYNVQIRG